MTGGVVKNISGNKNGIKLIENGVANIKLIRDAIQTAFSNKLYNAHTLYNKHQLYYGSHGGGQPSIKVEVYKGKIKVIEPMELNIADLDGSILTEDGLYYLITENGTYYLQQE